MRFVTKVWGCAASAAIVACSTLAYLNISDSSHMLQDQFKTHYHTLANNVASSFLQMERVTDTALLNAVKVYEQIEETEGPGTDLHWRPLPKSWEYRLWVFLMQPAALLSCARASKRDAAR